MDIRREQARYTLVEGEPLEIRHHRETLTVRSARPVTRRIPRAKALEPPTQPAGRAPARRRPPR